jgi:hypothetical protein
MADETETEVIADEIAAQHMTWFAANPKSELVTTCMVFPETGPPMMIQCPWRDEDERRYILARLRELMVVTRACRYAIWSEVWAAGRKMPKGMTEAEAIAKREREYTRGDVHADPDRFEAVFTLVVDASGKSAFRLQRIVRDNKGRVRDLEPQAEEVGMGGALADLLPPRTIN